MLTQVYYHAEKKRCSRPIVHNSLLCCFPRPAPEEFSAHSNCAWANKTVTTTSAHLSSDTASPHLREPMPKRKATSQLRGLIFSSWNASVSGLDRNRPPPLLGPYPVPFTALGTHTLSHPAPLSYERKKKLAWHHKQVDAAEQTHQPHLLLGLSHIKSPNTRH